MRYEPTINGLTKKAARQLGDAYYTIAESFEIIDSMAANSAASAHIIAGMSMEISKYNKRERAAQIENTRLANEMKEYKKPIEKRLILVVCNDESCAERSMLQEVPAISIKNGTARCSVCGKRLTHHGIVDYRGVEDPYWFTSDDDEQEHPKPAEPEAQA